MKQQNTWKKSMYEEISLEQCRQLQKHEYLKVSFTLLCLFQALYSSQTLWIIQNYIRAHASFFTSDAFYEMSVQYIDTHPDTNALCAFFVLIHSMLAPHNTIEKQLRKQLISQIQTFTKDQAWKILQSWKTLVTPLEWQIRIGAMNSEKPKTLAFELSALNGNWVFLFPVAHTSIEIKQSSFDIFSWVFDEKLPHFKRYSQEENPKIWEKQDNDIYWVKESAWVLHTNDEDTNAKESQSFCLDASSANFFTQTKPAHTLSIRV